MDVKLLEIERPPRPASPATVVRILLLVDGQQDWYEIGIEPMDLKTTATALLVPSEPLEDAFRYEQYALHRLLRVVGQDLRGVAVKLPQQIAA